MASRVMDILMRAAPDGYPSGGFRPEMDINVRKPLSTQLSKFQALGWASSPPSANAVMRGMVAAAESKAGLERHQPDAIREGDTTCFSAEAYLNFKPREADDDTRRRSGTRGRTSKRTGRVLAGGAHSGRQQVHTNNGATDAPPPGGEDFPEVFDDVVEMEDVFGPHAGEDHDEEA